MDLLVEYEDLGLPPETLNPSLLPDPSLNPSPFIKGGLTYPNKTVLEAMNIFYLKRGDERNGWVHLKWGV